MKRIFVAGLLTLSALPAYGSEIPGTRVLGQGAVCAAGQGKALEINVTTKEEISYCYEREPVIPPTQEQLEQRAREQIAQTLTQQNNANRETIVSDTPVTVEVEPINETLTVLEVNISTGVTIIRDYTEAEKDQAAKDRAQNNARQLAKEQAQQAASSSLGTEQCVNWSAAGGTGTECAFEPIPATEEEVEEQYDFLYNLFNFDWLSFLNLFDWNW